MDQRLTWVWSRLVTTKASTRSKMKTSQQLRDLVSVSATYDSRKWVLWKANEKSMSTDSALKSRLQRCAVQLKWRKSSRTTLVNKNNSWRKYHFVHVSFDLQPKFIWRLPSSSTTFYQRHGEVNLSVLHYQRVGTTWIQRLQFHSTTKTT